MKKLVCLMALFLLIMPGFAQHQELNSQPALWQTDRREPVDSNSLLQAFKGGKLNGHFRYFFMRTDNAPGLTDYYANALGGGIKFETARFNGFQFGVSGFFIFNIGSSDLSKPDPSTNQWNRYEIGLFDITDPENKTDINRLEELYLKYNWKKSFLRFGKQLLNTPFINLQDGRMRPTVIKGAWAEINQLKNIKIEGGYLYGVSPRSTVAWYTVGESIGKYPVGVNPDGSRSGYEGNIKSGGIGMLGITAQVHRDLSIKLWDLYAGNIFNSVLFQSDYAHSVIPDGKFVAGMQLIQQSALQYGGNVDPHKTYFEKGGESLSFGARMGWERRRWQTSFNVNRITAKGRYLMPREWGRDPFYTFLPRERNEGLGNVNAYLLKFDYSIPKARLKILSGIGYYALPDVTNYALNKYGIPSYGQVNIDLRYQFRGLLQGMEAQLLWAYKHNSGNTFENDKYVFNKVDMHLFNLVLNYHF